MKVLIPTPLRSYTNGRSEVQSQGATLAEVLANLDHAYPGIRFRMIDEQDAIRPHIRLFIGADEALNIDAHIRYGVTVHLICALSGG